MAEIPKLSTVTSATLDRLLTNAFEEICAMAVETTRGRTGGTARLRVGIDPSLGLRGWREVYISHIGKRERDNWQTVDDFSAEKTIRLMKMRALKGHVSSEESRNPTQWEFGGAFITFAEVPELGGEVLLLPAFSGLPDKIKGDETVWMCVLQKIGWAYLQNFSSVLAKSENNFAVDLLKRNIL